ncbi:Ascorbate utilization transcriptional regulator UlaR [Klebsiella aerogenes]|nr:Ascorbate utilization transcriptional regulator UlaR [Klebsiella aerogenes]
MTEAQRHQILLDLLAQTGFVTVEQVMSRLGISPAPPDVISTSWMKAAN